MNYLMWVCFTLFITISLIYWKRFIILKYIMKKVLVGNFKLGTDIKPSADTRRKRNTLVIDLSKLD